MYRQIGLWDNLADPEQIGQQEQSIAEVLSMPDARVSVYRTLFSEEESDRLFHELLEIINWKQEYIKLYGKSIPIPRLTAWYGDNNKSYTYSKITMNPETWNPTLLQIKSKIEDLSEVEFNSVLLNLYRHGSDGVAWHSDDEPELGENPVIGSVSFGATRRLMFRHKHQKELRQQIDLTQGSFLLMSDSTQHFWQHQVPKTSKSVGSRINLTFRVIK